jgi:hypothetical protein
MLTTMPTAAATYNAAHTTTGTTMTTSANANTVFHNISGCGTALTTTPAAAATDDAACITMGTTTTASADANAIFNNAISNNIAATDDPAAAAVASSVTEATTIDVIAEVNFVSKQHTQVIARQSTSMTTRTKTNQHVQCTTQKTYHCVEEESDNDGKRSSPCLSFRLPLLLENLELVFTAHFMMMV